MSRYLSTFFLIIFLSLTSLSPSIAKKIFRYQDDQGQWHYTDIPNKSTLKNSTTETILMSENTKKKALSIINKGNSQNPDYFIHNNFLIPIEVRVYATSSKNIITTPPLPLQKVISPKSEEYLFNVRQIDPYSEATFQFSYEEVFGDPKSIHDDSAIYQLPFEKNQSFFVSQGFNGATSHKDEQNRYAVDFSMPIGTKILASRTGTIVDIHQDFYENGLQKEYQRKANSIRILHDDGSMAVYAHLKSDRVFVYIGDRVNAGDLIAESGNTGFSSGPHLHFAVQMNTGMLLKSIPFQFTLSNNQRITPIQGDTVTHNK